MGVNAEARGRYRQHVLQLLDRHALGQSPWLIHIRAAQHRKIRQEL